MEALLRRFQVSDEEILRSWRRDPSVAQWMYTGADISADDHTRWFARSSEDAPSHRYRIYVVDGEPMGLCSLTQIDPAIHRSCHWGGYLRPGAQGRGLGEELLSLSCALAFTKLNLHKVWVEALCTNERAIALYEAFGFRREARFRDHVWKDGVPHDVVGLGLLRSEWPRRR